MTAAGPALTDNRLLAALPPQDLVPLESQRRLISLSLGEILFPAGDPAQNVYFPLSGMLSLVFTTAEGRALEIGLVGREGMLPINGFLGTPPVCYQALAQGPGVLAQLPAEAVQEQVRYPGPLRLILARYVSAALDQSRQVAVCNALHTVNARLARWLLMAHDRTLGDILPLTQEFLGLMLGVRRESVTAAELTLQRAGFIGKPYGRIEILDRAGLEARACECYGLMRDCAEAVFAGSAEPQQ
ncbi:MAG TPA: Crp/Fnr family transcriptional regulator [Dehalococcoidia bacterium]|nr:Crp/Fnr family transcriptional regulator [Dehalococcoidia bacterium]